MCGYEIKEVGYIPEMGRTGGYRNRWGQRASERFYFSNFIFLYLKRRYSWRNIEINFKKRPKEDLGLPSDQDV